MVGTTMVRAVREVASILAFGTPRVGLFGPGDIPKVHSFSPRDPNTP